MVLVSTDVYYLRKPDFRSIALCILMYAISIYLQKMRQSSPTSDWKTMNDTKPTLGQCGDHSLVPSPAVATTVLLCHDLSLVTLPYEGQGHRMPSLLLSCVSSCLCAYA